MTVYYLLLLVMTMIGSVAALFLKKASSSEGLGALLRNPNLYIGGLLYLTSAVLNIIVLRHLDYSLVLPLTAITYIWTIILSSCILKEQITLKKILGVVLIISGAICISI